MNHNHLLWATYDIETVNWNEFVIGCVYINNRKHFARTPYELVDILVSHKCKGRVYWAHVGGKFDIRFILEILLKNYDLKFRVVNNSLVRISVYKNKRKLFELRDSYNILTTSLKKLCESFNVPVKKLDVDRTRIQDLSKEELEQYVSIDCIALLQVLQEARKVFDVDDFCMTIASQSMKEWKRFENIKNYYVNAKKLYNFIRESYYGGRTEVFRRYGKNLHYYDINSMYPDAMRNNPYPKGRYMKVRQFHKSKLGIYRVKVKAPPFLEIPFLPYRNENNKLIFPLGSWEGVYTSVEIEKAITLGYSIECIEGVIWEEKAYPFTKYVDKWHGIKTQAKAEGNEAKTFIAKLHLNSLYGKFGQRRMFKKVVQGLDKSMLKKGCKPLFENMNLYEVNEPDKKPYTAVHIASFVTSYARIRLYEGIEAVKKKNGRVFYCDTDSLVCDVRIPEGHKLGEWELESEIDEGIFLLPKLYAYKIGEKVVFRAKGFDRECLSWDAYEKAVKQDFSGFVSVRERIAGLFDASRRGLSIIDTVELRRSLSGTFDKRELCGDLIQSLPHTL